MLSAAIRKGKRSYIQPSVTGVPVASFSFYKAKLTLVRSNIIKHQCRNAAKQTIDSANSVFLKHQSSFCKTFLKGEAHSERLSQWGLKHIPNLLKWLLVSYIIETRILKYQLHDAKDDGFITLIPNYVSHTTFTVKSTHCTCPESVKP